MITFVEITGRELKFPKVGPGSVPSKIELVAVLLASKVPKDQIVGQIGPDIDIEVPECLENRQIDLLPVVAHEHVGRDQSLDFKGNNNLFELTRLRRGRSCPKQQP